MIYDMCFKDIKKVKTRYITKLFKFNGNNI